MKSKTFFGRFRGFFSGGSLFASRHVSAVNQNSLVINPPKPKDEIPVLTDPQKKRSKRRQSLPDGWFPHQLKNPRVGKPGRTVRFRSGRRSGHKAQKARRKAFKAFRQNKTFRFAT